jgi:hypothetical protein
LILPDDAYRHEEGVDILDGEDETEEPDSYHFEL